ncbi:MAG: anthranilate synthase component I family protein [Bacteroidia bacterium]|nr:anthranilate synthase component I family protein [Bacteroidia bacterium]
MRRTLSFPTNLSENLELIHRNLQEFQVYTILNSNVQELSKLDKYSKYEILIAVDYVEECIYNADVFADTQNFIAQKKDWIFGHFSYDLKNEIENLESRNTDSILFPLIYFYQPRYVIRQQDSLTFLDYLPEHNTEKEAELFVKKLYESSEMMESVQSMDPISATVDKSSYIQNVRKIKDHIQRGDIYEMNYCTEFFAKNAKLDVANLYAKLNDLSPMPFSCVYKMKDRFAICASPERFIAKRENKIISQPIKGTARRGATKEEDLQIMDQLYNDPKERAENVMIVDLVRNDLSRTAKKGSVEVEELFGISSFRHLHQMISTIVSIKKDDVDSINVIKAAFPMGSMTGAPKVRAMELIEEFEVSRRGLYSGAIGYFSPDGDFDFNVVIRSILYNASQKTVSCSVGSAITSNSDPEKEFEECMLKAESLKTVLSVM